MKCLMYGLLFLQLSTSLGCFHPRTLFEKRIALVSMDFFHIIFTYWTQNNQQKCFKLIMGHMDVFSVYPFPLWWLREYTLYLIIIINSEVWTNTHCLGLGHETMVCAVCLSIFLLNVMFCSFYIVLNNDGEVRTTKPVVSHYLHTFLTRPTVNKIDI